MNTTRFFTGGHFFYYQGRVLYADEQSNSVMNTPIDVFGSYGALQLFLITTLPSTMVINDEAPPVSPNPVSFFFVHTVFLLPLTHRNIFYKLQSLNFMTLSIWHLYR
jgi:hypothetical protein